MRKIAKLFKKLWAGDFTFVLFNFEIHNHIEIDGEKASKKHISQKDTDSSPCIAQVVAGRLFTIIIIILLVIIILALIWLIIRVLFIHLPSESPIDRFVETGLFFENQDSRCISWAEIQSLFVMEGISPQWAIQAAINSFYAQAHLYFTERSDWYGFFEQWSWYQPDANVSAEMAWASMSVYAQENVNRLSIARRWLS